VKKMAVREIHKSGIEYKMFTVRIPSTLNEEFEDYAWNNRITKAVAATRMIEAGLNAQREQQQAKN